MPAEIGLAVAPLNSDPIKTLGQLQLGHAWSSMKVPILVTLMREGKLSAEEQQWATAALTASDNTAAADLFPQLERTHGGLSGASLAVQEILAKAGDTSTTVATAPPPPGAVSTWGQTDWSLTGAVEFYREMARGCLLSPSDTEYVRQLMGEVIPEQRWGLGEAGFPTSWRVEMKGGWGPENGTGRYLVRQSGVVQDGNTGFAVTMITKADSGSFETGAQELTQMATWLREHIRSPLPPDRTVQLSQLISTGSCLRSRGLTTIKAQHRRWHFRRRCKLPGLRPDRTLCRAVRGRAVCGNRAVTTTLMVGPCDISGKGAGDVRANRDSRSTGNGC